VAKEGAALEVRVDTILSEVANVPGHAIHAMALASKFEAAKKSGIAKHLVHGLNVATVSVV